MGDDENAKEQSLPMVDRYAFPTARAKSVYHRRPIACCILAGDTDGGGLDMLIPVLGLTMGMALRIRVAAG